MSFFIGQARFLLFIPQGTNNVPLSSTFTVSVLASGKPRPTLTWYGPRGEVLVSNSSLSIEIRNTNGSIGDNFNFILYKDRRLDITSVTYYHNGTYTCVASNRIDALGNVYSVNRTMTLIVVGKFVHSCRIDLYINHSFFLFLPFIAFSIVLKVNQSLRLLLHWLLLYQTRLNSQYMLSLILLSALATLFGAFSGMMELKEQSCAIVTALSLITGI